MTWRHLELFAGGYGSAMGYAMAGATSITCVDFVRRRDLPEGPFSFLYADAREVLSDLTFLRSFDSIGASAPCKVHTRLAHMTAAQGNEPIHGDLLGFTRDRLDLAGVPYILENVEGAPMRPDVLLCGSMFGLHTSVRGERRWLKRHRLFELGGWGNGGFGIAAECVHPGGRPVGVYGHTIGDNVGGVPGSGGEVVPSLRHGRDLMGMPWASWASLTQAIPPAYTAYLGFHLAAHLGVRPAALGVPA